MRKIVTMREALEDPNLLGKAMTGPSWLPMRALCIAAMGEQLTDEERVHFQALTKREREPLKRVKRFVVVARAAARAKAIRRPAAGFIWPSCAITPRI
jgi:hypothetical protein